LSQEARHDVGDAAGSKADDEAHRPRWIGLRPRKRRTDQGGPGVEELAAIGFLL
jgi:hypothetical protein